MTAESKPVKKASPSVVLHEGDLAPNFKLQDDQGKTVSLSDYRGKKVVLYFYPKDDTAGCTKEACSIRDNYAKLQTMAVILGVSADSVESHKQFAEKYHLPFTLLSDPKKEVIKKTKTRLEKRAFDFSLFATIALLVTREGFEIALFTASTSLFAIFFQNMLGLLVGFGFAGIAGTLAFSPTPNSQSKKYFVLRNI